MTAVCTQCGRVWNISIRTSPTGYVCPDCEYRERMVAVGVLKEGESESYCEKSTRPKLIGG